MLGLRPPALALVQPGSINDLVHLRAVLGNVGPVIEARTATLRRDVAKGNALKRAAEVALESLATGQRALIAQRSALAALAAERRRAADKLAGSAMIEQDRAMAMGEEARDIGALMGQISEAADLNAQLESLSGPVLRPARPGDPRPLPVDSASTAGQSPYRLPVVGAIVSGLGEVSDAGVRARGLTIATRASAQVVAPTGGRIVFAGPYRGYGNIVIIDHGRGWTTLLTGLAMLDAKVGDPVDQGSPIGKAGPARPTITVELRRRGQPIDITQLVD
jgi:murein hydrolase activator